MTVRKQKKESTSQSDSELSMKICLLLVFIQNSQFPAFVFHYQGAKYNASVKYPTESWLSSLAKREKMWQLCERRNYTQNNLDIYSSHAQYDDLDGF